MGHIILLPLLTLLTPRHVLVQSKTCTVKSSVEDGSEAELTTEIDRSEAEAATTAT